jgi:hypothetical protein
MDINQQVTIRNTYGDSRTIYGEAASLFLEVFSTSLEKNKAVLSYRELHSFYEGLIFSALYSLAPEASLWEEERVEKITTDELCKEDLNIRQNILLLMCLQHGVFKDKESSKHTAIAELIMNAGVLINVLDTSSSPLDLNKEQYECVCKKSTL